MHMHVYLYGSMHVGAPGGQTKRVDSPGTGVSGNCESLGMVLGAKPESCPQTPKLSFLFLFLILERSWCIFDPRTFDI